MQRPHRALISNGSFLEVQDRFLDRLGRSSVQVIPHNHTVSMTDWEVHELGIDADIIFGPSAGLDASLFEANRNLKIISIAASGYEGVDLDAATGVGILVTNAPSPLWSEAVADLTWGLLIAAARHIPQSHHRIVTAAPNDRVPTRQPRPLGHLVWGKTLGIVGLGNIGRRVAIRAKGFNMRVIAHTRTWDEQFAGLHGIERSSFEEILQESDFVSLHVREDAQTRRLLGTKELELMKPTSCLINTSRMGIIDVPALTNALCNNKIAAAGLDTAIDNGDTPLIDLPNVVSTPHLGNRNLEAILETMDIAIRNVEKLLNGNAPPFLLNPEAIFHSRLRRTAGIE